MSESLLLVLDFNSVCRLCLCTRSHVLADISHDSDPNYENTTSVYEQITYTTGVQITQEDNLPQKICYKCRHLVELAYGLRYSAERTTQLLLEALKNVRNENFKEEIQDAPIFEEQIEEFLDEPIEEFLDEHAFIATVDNFNADTGTDKNEKDKVGDQQTPTPDVQGTNTVNTTKTINEARKPPKPPHYTRKKYTCNICLIVFSARESLTTHVRQHYRDSSLTPYVDLVRPYKCEQCKAYVKNVTSLVEHHCRHLGLKQFACTQPGCGFVGKSRDSIRYHNYKHGPTRLVCETCGAAFRRACELQQHRARHVDTGQSFPCRCGVVCSNSITLKAHVKTHDQSPRFKCSRPGCPKSFYQRAHLAAHVRAHEDDRAHVCHLCVASYTSRSLLNRHLRKHEQRKRSKCDKCCRTFDDYAEYCNHRLTRHGQWQPYKCIGCNQGYQSESRLSLHTARCKLAINARMTANSENLSQLSTDVTDRPLSAVSMDTLDSLLRTMKTGEKKMEDVNLALQDEMLLDIGSGRDSTLANTPYPDKVHSKL